VIANALIGVQRALVADVRRQLLAREPVDAAVRQVRVRGRRAMSVLQRGLAAAGTRWRRERGRLA
jgi:hypothetical protein